MYQFISAAVLPVGINTSWKEVNIKQMIVKNVYQNYKKIIIKVKRTLDNIELYLDIEKNYNQFNNYNYTIEVMLNNLTPLNSHTTELWPLSNVRTMRYEDIHRLNYKVKLARLGYNNLDNLRHDELEDIMIEPRYNMQNTKNIHYYGMVTINGYIHNTGWDGNNVYAIGGGKTYWERNLDIAGLISLPTAEPVSKLNFQESWIKELPDIPFYQSMILSIPNLAEEDTVLFVIGGYLYLPDQKGINRLNATDYKFNLCQTAFQERLIDIVNLIDKETPLDTTQITLDKTVIQSNDYIVKVLLHYLSHVVIIKGQQLGVNYITLRSTNIPNSFKTYQEPIYPLLNNYGRLMEYWKQEEDGHWTLDVVNGNHNKYLHNRHNKDRYTKLTDKLENGFRHMTTQFLKVDIY